MQRGLHQSIHASTVFSTKSVLLSPTSSYIQRKRLRHYAIAKRPEFEYPGEYTFNLSEYMVVLDKPLGLTLAPNPKTGQIVVLRVEDDSPAGASQLIQVGDVLKWCSAVMGDEMWECDDLQRVRWSINNRQGKVQLILERSPSTEEVLWYHPGQLGMTTFSSEALQLPVRFSQHSPSDAVEPVPYGAGKCLWAHFHRHAAGRQWAGGEGGGGRGSGGGHAQPTPIRHGPTARQCHADRYRNELLQVRDSPSINMVGAVQSRASNGDRASGMQYTMSGSPAPPCQNGALPHPVPSSSPSPAPGSSSRQGFRRQEGATREKKVLQFLPWLLVSNSRLNTKDLTRLASQLGLGSILELGLQVAEGMVTLRGSNTSPSNPAQALVLAAAALQRLNHRRRGACVTHCPPELCSVLLHCEENMEEETAVLLAGWLHWYGYLGFYEAIQGAEMSLGVPVNEALLICATCALVEGAKERFSQVAISWPYGGLTCDVSGELVGGWNVRVPLKRCQNPLGCKGAHRGHFFLELKGLKPGRYHYKYIVDGTWAVDPYTPKDLDSMGNWNNVLDVHQPPSIISDEDQLRFARLQAAYLAFETKLALPGRC